MTKPGNPWKGDKLMVWKELPTRLRVCRDVLRGDGVMYNIRVEEGSGDNSIQMGALTGNRIIITRCYFRGIGIGNHHGN